MLLFFILMLLDKWLIGSFLFVETIKHVSRIFRDRIFQNLMLEVKLLLLYDFANLFVILFNHVLALFRYEYLVRKLLLFLGCDWYTSCLHHWKLRFDLRELGTSFCAPGTIKITNIDHFLILIKLIKLSYLTFSFVQFLLKNIPVLDYN